MVLNVSSIATPGLMYCADVFDSGTDENDDVARRAIKNILKAQSFDSIPLRNSEGDVRRIARRRLHKGDLKRHVFILDIDECASSRKDSSILSALFAILSNEHHILLVMDEKKQLEGLVTLNLIAQPVVLDYLRLKFAQLEELGWQWNREFLGEVTCNHLTYAREVYENIVRLAKMVDDNKPLPDDIEFSKQIVRILLLLQPLKNINDDFGGERFWLEPKSHTHPDDTALSLMTKPAAALIEDDEEVMRTVFRIFARENDWDYLVVRDKKHEPKQMLSIESQENMSYQNIERVEPLAHRFSMIQSLIDRDFCPLFCIDEETDELGIISIEELLLDDGFIPKILERISKVEENTRLRSFLEGNLYIREGKYGALLVAKANWIDIIAKQPEEIREPLDSLREWRNLLAHSYLALVGTRNLPVWMRYGFLEGIINIETCEAALGEVETDQVYTALFGLNEYLKRYNNGNDFFRKSCGLFDAGVGDEDNLILQFVEAPHNWKKILGKIPTTDLITWTGLSRIDVR
jgi:hypothetical protein